MENANIVYGRLTEAAHFSGYSLERAMGELKWLMEDDRWKEVGPGYTDFNEFANTLKIDEFKYAIEQRKELSKKFEELKATQRTTAKVLGVGQSTINRDLNDSNESKTEEIVFGNQQIIDSHDSNESKNNIEWFEKEGKKVAEREQKNVHVSNNSGENEWYTPTEIIEAARKVMGSIDLDPASSLIANEIIKAEIIFTKDEDGLTQDWYGNVWLNPPYSQPLISQFSDKLIEELPKLDEACVLVNNATETNWLQNMMNKCSTICFLKGRVRFVDPLGNATGAPLQGQVILYFGKKITTFFNEFNELGICMMMMRGER